MEFKVLKINKENIIQLDVRSNWEALHNKRIELVKKNQMNLFGSLSHELRTPLNCSMSMLEQLQSEVENQELVNEYIIPALNSHKILINLINELLDFI